MKRYYYQLINEQCEEFEAFLPDGSHKENAANRARKWMRENGIAEATLVVNSIFTSNILDMILLTTK